MSSIQRRKQRDDKIMNEWQSNWFFSYLSSFTWTVGTFSCRKDLWEQIFLFDLCIDRITAFTVYFYSCKIIRSANSTVLSLLKPSENALFVIDMPTLKLQIYFCIQTYAASPSYVLLSFYIEPFFLFEQSSHIWLKIIWLST